ncbi:MAG: MoaD/ThiS family protein [Coprothermobacterota bacterium]|nr:MoaD/ThiS family protein [Coprothermobacterota bacterium]
MPSITVDLWLYGALAHKVGEADQEGFANLTVSLPAGSTMADLLIHVRVGSQERGITFINGQLSAMPGLWPDLNHVLSDSDRVGIFDPKSMWPFQYRLGAATTDELAQAMLTLKDDGLHHTYS